MCFWVRSPCSEFVLQLQWLETRPSRQQCPVCKAGISRDKVIPLYGRGSSSQEDPRYTCVYVWAKVDHATNLLLANSPHNILDICLPFLLYCMCWHVDVKTLFQSCVRSVLYLARRVIVRLQNDRIDFLFWFPSTPSISGVLTGCILHLFCP